MSNIYSYQCLGLISGSSLDGLDIAHVQIDLDVEATNPISSWTIEKATTIEYPDTLVQQLRSLPHGTALELVQMNDELGKFFGASAHDFIDINGIDFISSHGHTVFHHPGFSSTQIGNPAIIAAITGTKTIGYLRNMDTAYGGQGAPLAPMADLYLLPEHDICVNLGGIANISIKSKEGIVGFDVCGANQFLNYLSNQVGQPFDYQGKLARSGQVDKSLLQQLNDLSYCKQAIPKSLDNEQVRQMYLPLLNDNRSTVEDKLATMVEHTAIQIAVYISPDHRSIHLAGGGAHNTYLVERLKAHCPETCKIHVPEPDIINFKEAALIAMCGVLRLHELPNSLKSITGANKDTVNGVVFLP